MVNLVPANQIAKAVLYEGYMLYPYRPSSVKNRQRWHFGVLYPEAYSRSQDGADAYSMRTECLVRGSPETTLALRLRFLQLQVRRTRHPAASTWADGWQEAVEREVTVPAMALERLSSAPAKKGFALRAQFTINSHPNSGTQVERRQAAIEGDIAITAGPIHEGLFKVRADVRNTTPIEASAAARDDALLQSLVSTHIILGVDRGEFLSPLEPPQLPAAHCENVGAWPVLVGKAGERDTLLASPIILDEYPQVAPESPGDLFDGTEIDEILSLRILTLTDEEKCEVRRSDERARQILERTETMPAEQFMKLHGAVRGLRALKEGAP